MTFDAQANSLAVHAVGLCSRQEYQAIYKLSTLASESVANFIKQVLSNRISKWYVPDPTVE